MNYFRKEAKTDQSFISENIGPGLFKAVSDIKHFSVHYAVYCNIPS